MNIRWLHRSPKAHVVTTPESPVEALEWHEMHERLAPLADQLPVAG
jgi:hypothetical protein